LDGNIIMQAHTSKQKEYLTKQEREKTANLAKLKAFAEGHNTGAFAGGQPLVNNFMPEINTLVSESSKTVYNLYQDRTRTYHEQVRLASMVAKDTTKRLDAISNRIYAQIAANDTHVKAAYDAMKEKGLTSNHQRSQAVRERLQDMDYVDLLETIKSDQHVAGIFLGDPKMIYDISSEQHEAIRHGLLSEHHPEAHTAMKSQDGYFKAYEALVINTQTLADTMVIEEDAKKAASMRVETQGSAFGGDFIRNGR